MRNKNKILREIKKLTRDYFSIIEDREFIHGESAIPLSIPSYDEKESYEAIESILTTWVTMGEKVQKFEEMFAKYIGTSSAVMVTSGSTANHLALSVLTNQSLERRILPGDEIITPALTFATTVYPIIDIGAVPVLVDVDRKSLNISLEEVEKAITPKTKAIMPVHLLGNPCDMYGIMEIAKKNNLFVIEDVCDSSGAEIGGKKAGSFGDVATYSFFFTHIMSTIEGGMVVSNDERYIEIARSLRSFGWIRDLKDKNKIAERYENINPRFLFINKGYNFKPTEIQGAFGIHQIGKIDEFVGIRRKNANFWSDNLRKYSNYFQVLEEKYGTKSAWYGYPIIVNPKAPFSRKNLTDFLESKGLQTRPILSGNMSEQPVMEYFNYKKIGNLPNVKTIHSNAFFIGNHQGIGKIEREAVIDYFDEFMLEVR